MGGMELLLIAVAIVSVIISAFVLVKFKDIKISLVAGLVAVAVILGLVIYVSENPKVKDNDVLSVPTVSPSFSLTVDTTPTAATSTPDKTEQASVDYTPSATVKPTSTPDTNIYKTPEPAMTVNPEAGKNSVIYLTFDDGPSGRTPEVLDILKKYNIKATFFIVNFDDSQIPVLKRVIDEGHSIGIHGYSHVYADAYKSEGAFMENVTKLRERIKDKLGYDTTLMRFPGGSSNSVSAKYCTGIMSKLVVTVEKEGYQYFDWNVDSRDAEGFDAAGIINTVTSTTKGTREVNIVLMHDAGDKRATVQALPDVIEWGLANGYTFSNLTSSSPTVHHVVNN